GGGRLYHGSWAEDGRGAGRFERPRSSGGNRTFAKVVPGKGEFVDGTLQDPRPAAPPFQGRDHGRGRRQRPGLGDRRPGRALPGLQGPPARRSGGAAPVRERVPERRGRPPRIRTEG